MVAVFFGLTSVILAVIYLRRKHQKNLPKLPSCSRPYIVTPLSFDKNYEISKSNMSLLKRFDGMLPIPDAPEDEDEGDSYYSSLILPSDDSSMPGSNTVTPKKPTPPPETTIPERPLVYVPPSLVNQNFRVISKYPVPITEL